MNPYEWSFSKSETIEFSGIKMREGKKKKEERREREMLQVR